jgi:teichuronic acid exporter
MNKRSHDSTFRSAIRWLAAGRFAGQIISWVITILVIRILTPADYGLAAMIITITSLMTLVAEFGFGVAVIQAKEITKEQISIISGAAITFGAFAFTVGILIAPLAANYYKEPQLQLLLQVAVFIFLISSMGTIPDSLLRREHRYNILATIDFTSTLIGAFTTLILAYSGNGVWSLVLGTVATSCTRVVILFLTNKNYSFTPTFNFKKARNFIKFGSEITLSRISAYFVGQSDVLIGGRLLGKESMGIYYIALDLAMLPLTKMMNIINQAAIPTLADIKRQESPNQKLFLLRTLRLLSYVIIPCLWGIASISPWLVPVVLGDKWLAAIIPLQLICFMLPARMLSNLVSTALISFGHSSTELKIQSIGILIFPISFIIGAQFGVIGLALGLFFALPLMTCFGILKARHVLNLKINEILNSMLPPIAISGLMVLCVSGLGHLLLSNNNNWLSLCILTFSGVLIYTATLYIYDKDSFISIKSILHIKK